MSLYNTVIKRGDHFESTLFEHVLIEVPANAGKITRSSIMQDDVREKAKLEGYHVGYETGLAAGMTEGLTEGQRLGKSEADFRYEKEVNEALHGLKADIANLLFELRTNSLKWFKSTEDQITDIVIDIAKNVVANELEQKQDGILSMVQQAILATGVKGDIRIRINPLDKAHLTAHREWLEASLPQVQGIEIIYDPQIHSGCFIDTGTGTIDATIEGKFLALEQKLTEERTINEEAA